MARGWSGAILRPNGTIFVGPVTLPDSRVANLRELVLDLALPGLCIILGAGASHGVVPITPKEIANHAWKMLQSQSNFLALSSTERETLGKHPEILYLRDVLENVPAGAWDRFLSDLLSPGQASVILNDIFTPPQQVPPALVDIYNVLENDRGVVVSYNYDRIAEAQSRFRVITPHGQRSALLTDARFGNIMREMASEMHIAIPNEWHLPVPEDEQIRLRSAYQDMVSAWRSARTVVFVGYGFGAGADAISFQDFAVNVAPSARIHVLCPTTDNADLSKQVGSALRSRGARFRVYGQPFRWRAFAEAVLSVLRVIPATHMRFAIGKETDIATLHDRL